MTNLGGSEELFFNNIKSSLYISEVIGIEQIKKLVFDILHSYPDMHCVLFGSYAKHCANKASDIDIG